MVYKYSNNMNTNHHYHHRTCILYSTPCPIGLTTSAARPHCFNVQEECCVRFLCGERERERFPLICICIKCQTF